MTGYIYKLVNPESSMPIYVGLTTVGIGSRLKEHIRLSKKPKAAIHRHINNCQNPPLIEILEKVDFRQKSELREREKHWINKLSSDGIALMNTVRYANLGWDGAIFARTKKTSKVYINLKKMSVFTGRSMNEIGIIAIEEYLKKHKIK